MIFWILPKDKFLAFIPRTGSTAWGQAILDNFYQEEKRDQLKACTPDNSLASPQYFIPSTRNPKGTLFGVIRNPIERFRSGFSRSAKGRTVDQLIDDLLTGKEKPINIHIRPVTDQFEHHYEKMTWFKYERDLENLAKEIGIDYPDTKNESEESDKPLLTDAQIAKLKQIYAQDFVLYRSLN